MSRREWTPRKNGATIKENGADIAEVWQEHGAWWWSVRDGSREGPVGQPDTARTRVEAALAKEKQ